MDVNQKKGSFPCGRMPWRNLWPPCYQTPSRLRTVQVRKNNAKKPVSTEQKNTVTKIDFETTIVVLVVQGIHEWRLERGVLLFAHEWQKAIAFSPLEFPHSDFPHSREQTQLILLIYGLLICDVCDATEPTNQSIHLSQWLGPHPLDDEQTQTAFPHQWEDSNRISSST